MSANVLRVDAPRDAAVKHGADAEVAGFAEKSRARSTAALSFVGGGTRPYGVRGQMAPLGTGGLNPGAYAEFYRREYARQREEHDANLRLTADRATCSPLALMVRPPQHLN